MTTTIRPVPGTADYPRTTPPWWRRFGLGWSHDWDSFLFWRVNWSNFTLIEVAGEIEYVTSTAEIELAVVGLHLRLTYYWPSAERDELNRLARLAEAGMLDTAPAPETDLVSHS